MYNSSLSNLRPIKGVRTLKVERHNFQIFLPKFGPGLPQITTICQLLHVLTTNQHFQTIDNFNFMNFQLTSNLLFGAENSLEYKALFLSGPCLSLITNCSEQGSNLVGEHF